MKARSLIYKRTAALTTALALSSALALGMTGCITINASSSDASSSSSASSSSQQAAENQEQAQSESTESSSGGSSDANISDKQALNKALKEANLEESQVRMLKNEFEIDDGVAKYEIDFIGPDNMEYEYEIDANTGEILSQDIEPWD